METKPGDLCEVVEIRPGTSADAAACERLYRQEWDEIEASLQHGVVRRPSVSTDEAALPVGRGPFAVACLGSEVVGFALASRRAPELFEVIDLFVRTDCRDGGVGTRLLVSVERAAVALGTTTIFAINSLDYFPAKRPAETFYRRHGYRPVELHRGTTLWVKSPVVA